MPVAAVPNYLGKDFSTASPGMRFGMYLKLWGINEQSKKLLWTTHDVIYRIRGRDKRERELEEDNKRAAIDTACRLTQGDTDLMQALILRQQTLAATMEPKRLLTVFSQSIAPFSTGLGNEHPLENGFAFLWPYGLPYLPGSGVKGVLRQAARELAGLVEDVSWDENYGWNTDVIEVLFGRESEEGEQAHCRGVLSFWDVIPKIEGGRLMVEIMTPHQHDYYQKGQSPHDSGQPTPITFLTVPPRSNFTFHIHCDRNRLQQLAPDLARNERWKNLLESAFQHAFDWLGFGAKTAVGYGAMRRDEEAEKAAERELEENRRRAEEEARLTDLSPLERELEEISTREKNNNVGVVLLNLLDEGRWENAADKRMVAAKIKALWQAEKKWNPDFSGTNRSRLKQKARCEKVVAYLQSED